MVLASKIFTKVSYAQLKQWVPLLREEARNQNPRKRGLNGEGIYDSSDYRTVYHLLHGEKCKQEDDFFKMSLLVFVFTKLLEASKQFFIDDGVPFIPNEEDFILTALLFFHHCRGLRRYSHDITNVKVNVATQECEFLKFSSGIYPTGVLSRHSCHPVSVPSFFGNTMVLRAVTFIKVGEEVTHCYGSHFADNSKELREYILSRFNIICKCMACKNNWPIYKDISKNITLKCLNCSAPIHSKSRCHKCKQAFPHVMRQLLNFLVIFENTFINRKFLLDITDEQRKVLYEITEFAYKHLLLPCRFYVDIQRILCSIFSMDGNHFFVSDD